MSEPISMIGAVIYDAKRFATIANVLRKFGFTNLVNVLKTGIAGDARSSQEILSSFKEKPTDMAARLRGVIEELGTTYIKFGQMLSTRYDLLPKEIITELSKLQDASPQIPFDTVEKILNDAYGNYHDVFAELDPVPLGSASIAQVHRGVTTQGERVVVKVQRPNLLPLIRSDIDILNLIARVFDDNIEEIAYFNLPALIAEFERATISELNFNRERENIAYFIQQYGNRPMFAFPEPLDALSRQNILVMRELRGQKITDLPHNDPNAKIMADEILAIAFDMVFRDGVFHGDPHPGNVLATQDGKIGLLDFGLVGTFTKRQRQDFMRLVIAVQAGDNALVARTLLSLGHPTRRVILANLEAEIARILQKYLKSSLKNLDIAAFAADFIAAGQTFGVQIPSEFTNAVRALISLEGIIQYLNPDLDLVDTLGQFSRKLLANGIDQKNLATTLLSDFFNVRDFAAELPSHIVQFTQDLEHDGLAIRHNPADMAPITDAINTASFRIAISLMLSAFTLAFLMADPKMNPLFDIPLILDLLWCIVLVCAFLQKRTSRRKIRVQPFLTRMRRRQSWF